jgi:ABC-type polysaccharide/polyol phosphate export permease
MRADRLTQFLKMIYQPLGVDLFCTGKKFLIYNLVGRNIKSKYRRSILGLFWTLLTPISMTMMYYFVFKVVMQVRMPHHTLFILTGVLTWNFVGQSILESMEAIVTSVGLLSKVPIPIQTFPLAGTITNFVTFLLALPVLLGTALFSGVHLGSALIAFPFYILAILLMSYSFGLTLAIFYIRLRDLRHLMSIGLQLWMWATPVLYEAAMIPQKYKWTLYVNPFGWAFADIHGMWLRNQWPSLESAGSVGIWTLSSVVLCAAVHRFLSQGLVEQI